MKKTVQLMLQAACTGTGTCILYSSNAIILGNFHNNLYIFWGCKCGWKLLLPFLLILAIGATIIVVTCIGSYLRHSSVTFLHYITLALCLCWNVAFFPYSSHVWYAMFCTIWCALHGSKCMAYRKFSFTMEVYYVVTLEFYLFQIASIMFNGMLFAYCAHWCVLVKGK